MSDLIKREDAIRAVAEVLSLNRFASFKNIKDFGRFAERMLRNVPSADRPQEWITCSERLPETDNTNEINEFDVLLAVRPKKHPKRTPQVYIGKLRPVEGDDGSGNFWGVKIAPCEWTIWGWSYFQEPEVLAWMPLPQPMKGADDER